MGLTLRDLGELVLAILLPPLAVFLHKGVLDTDVLINILLTLLGWLPGECLHNSRVGIKRCVDHPIAGGLAGSVGRSSTSIIPGPTCRERRSNTVHTY